MVKKQIGGDGYVINVNEVIGGRPGITRYSNNYRPVFDGQLLQNGEELLQSSEELLQSGVGDCGCSGSDPSIFNLIQQGGNKVNDKLKKKTKTIKNKSIKKENIDKNINNKQIKKEIRPKNIKKEPITQFHAIREVAYILTPLSLKALIILIVKLVLFILSKIKPKRSIQFGGFVEKLQEIIAPLGKNNLLVLASLLLLHHFAVESNKVSSLKSNEVQLGGTESFMNSVSEILAPLGVNRLGSSIILIILQQAFTRNLITNSNKINQKGGNPLKNLIAPLGTNAFIAAGLLIIIEKLFNDKMRELKSNNKENKILIGGKINKKFEKLFNMIAPITFNAFAKESFLKKMAL